MPLPLVCRCNESKWELHPEKIVCTSCKLAEHFEPHESIAQVVERLKYQGCYFLGKDKGKLGEGISLVITGYSDRR